MEMERNGTKEKATGWWRIIAGLNGERFAGRARANLERIRRSPSVSIVVVCKNSAFAIFPGSILLARQSTLRKGRTNVRETMSDVANPPEILAKWLQIFF